MNCLYWAGPERPAYEAAQQTLGEFSIICDDFLLEILHLHLDTNLHILVKPTLDNRYRRPKYFQFNLIQS
ncbi:hypothetical protein H1R20_g14029, partial [Candolleomyces eurysporus]